MEANEDKPQFACPFCKFDPKTWLHHEKCGNKGRKPAEKLNELIRWHVFGTHFRYNKDRSENDKDHIKPEVFQRLFAWRAPRRDWTDPVRIWKGMYAAIAGLNANQWSSIPNPYWTEEWVKDTLNVNENDQKLKNIQKALADEQARVEINLLMAQLKGVKQQWDDTITRLCVMTQANIEQQQKSLDIQISIVNQQNETRFNELQKRLDDKIRSVADHAADLQQIGTGDEVNASAPAVSVGSSNDMATPRPTPLQLPANHASVALSPHQATPAGYGMQQLMYNGNGIDHMDIEDGGGALYQFSMPDSMVHSSPVNIRDPHGHQPNMGFTDHSPAQHSNGFSFGCSPSNADASGDMSATYPGSFQQFYQLSSDSASLSSGPYMSSGGSYPSSQASNPWSSFNGAQ